MSGVRKDPFSKASSADKEDFLAQARNARESRAKRQVKDDAATIIQKHVRGFLERSRFHKIIIEKLDEAISYNPAAEEYKPLLKPASEVFPCARRYLHFKIHLRTTKRYECLCKYILLSLSSDSTRMSYLSVLLNKALAVSWIEHMKQILTICLHRLTVLKPEHPADLRTVNTYLTVLVSFTSPANWKILTGKAADVLRPAMTQLCGNIMTHLASQEFYSSVQALLFSGVVKTKPLLKPATLSAICTLVLRMLQNSQFNENSIREFLLAILSVPALIYHLQDMSPDVYTHFIGYRVFSHCLTFLANEEQLQAVAVTLEGNRTLCLLANLIQLGTAEIEGVVDNTTVFTGVLGKLLEVCGQFMMGKKTNKSHWHPILGWASQQFDYNEAVPYLTKQLQLLWAPKTIHLLFMDMLEYSHARQESSPPPDTKKKSALRKKKPEKKVPTLKPDSQLIQNTCASCIMYQTAITVLVQIQAEILSGLAFNPELLVTLWKLMKQLGSCGLKVFLDSLTYPPSHLLPVTSILTLFCDAAIMLFMILDDYEMYDKQKPFNLQDLVELSDMLNQFTFKVIWQDTIDWRQAENEPLFVATHSLLQLLYERDCRRTFVPSNHWLIKDVRPALFISSIDKGNKTSQFLLQKMPHMIPHKDRVILFRKWVIREKEALGITESTHSTPNITFVTIHRQRLLEDGYRHLAGLPVLGLKGIIRVKFINEQGLDEAGIDQDGVFKEFLEETIKRVFDPSLNLFRVTEEQKLYPSPTSEVQENHLALFEFVGRMIGKAVYEGIVVDVPFAPFFLTQVLDNMKNSMYSYLDELPSLDPQLYKNLTYVKHYEGDVSDLELNFSYDEDFMGKLRNFELKPGGRAIQVTNENKISYVHYMARFKMHTQIREQTNAFVRGFRSIINYDWLKMFSTPEVQKLISGDTIDIDLTDLRKHTQYYGGFHNSHRVIVWLWDLLEKDFTEKERGQFLKFVTSCSKPPLLGFAQLDPPFSIRCVEVSDDQDTGDTIGSVLKGFFSIRRSEPTGRLPTSSTCFNLLKLPNYNKKSTLRDKLRYSINCNTGFELS